MLGKEDCELCDVAEALIRDLAVGEKVVPYQKIDILDDAFLTERYGWHIPVLICASPFESGQGVNASVDVEERNEHQYGQGESLAHTISTYLQKQNKRQAKNSGQPLCNDKGDAIELYWPFPVSRLRAFLSTRR